MTGLLNFECECPTRSTNKMFERVNDHSALAVRKRVLLQVARALIARSHVKSILGVAGTINVVFIFPQHLWTPADSLTSSCHETGTAAVACVCDTFISAAPYCLHYRRKPSEPDTKDATARETRAYIPPAFSPPAVSPLARYTETMLRIVNPNRQSDKTRWLLRSCFVSRRNVKYTPVSNAFS